MQVLWHFGNHWRDCGRRNSGLLFRLALRLSYYFTDGEIIEDNNLKGKDTRQVIKKLFCEEDAYLIKEGKNILIIEIQDIDEEIQLQNVH